MGGDWNEVSEMWNLSVVISTACTDVHLLQGVD